jgi:hypothetical protein
MMSNPMLLKCESHVTRRHLTAQLQDEVDRAFAEQDVLATN